MGLATTAVHFCAGGWSDDACAGMATGARDTSHAAASGTPLSDTLAWPRRTRQTTESFVDDNRQHCCHHRAASNARHSDHCAYSARCRRRDGTGNAAWTHAAAVDTGLVTVSHTVATRRHRACQVHACHTRAGIRCSACRRCPCRCCKAVVTAVTRCSRVPAVAGARTRASQTHAVTAAAGAVAADGTRSCGNGTVGDTALRLRRVVIAGCSAVVVVDGCRRVAGGAGLTELADVVAAHCVRIVNIVTDERRMLTTRPWSLTPNCLTQAVTDAPGCRDKESVTSSVGMTDASAAPMPD